MKAKQFNLRMVLGVIAGLAIILVINLDYLRRTSATRPLSPKELRLVEAIKSRRGVTDRTTDNVGRLLLYLTNVNRDQQQQIESLKQQLSALEPLQGKTAALQQELAGARVLLDECRLKKTPRATKATGTPPAK